MTKHLATILQPATVNFRTSVEKDSHPTARDSTDDDAWTTHTQLRSSIRNSPTRLVQYPRGGRDLSSLPVTHGLTTNAKSIHAMDADKAAGQSEMSY